MNYDTSYATSIPHSEHLVATRVSGSCWAKLPEDFDQSKIDKDEYITMTLPNSNIVLFWCNILIDETITLTKSVQVVRYVPIEVRHLPLVTL